ncbi:MAG: ABC transporter substrate-binding protein [Saprospiraceae bacterium]|nr:ABC transporter substrate-binding protein [Candidatus Vicinibacter affinis]MBK6571236.1 ABC transporter substrate-binding protein [Candidatus Vicinibacter affinis]MBK7799618.1 ABC transporter substrate-binding protein [Candidatus Vicinibacter affinis]MBP6172174.1 ABC transporter substrate-binding protein [Saprospiraceae bacterium]
MNCRFSRIYLLSVGFIWLTCCSDNTHKKPRVFHYNQPNPVTSLDPAFAKSQNNIWLIDHIYNQLIDLDDSMNLVPEIAKDWEVSKDGLSYLFHLRNDVFFHKNSCFGKDSTRRLKASDVEYSFLRLIDPGLSAPGRWIFAGKLDTFQPFNIINDTTLVIKLRQAFSPFLSLLTMQYCSIIPKEAVSFYQNKFDEFPVGTGPFVLNKWIDRQGIFLSRNSAYFKPNLPYLEGVRVSFIEDRNTAYLEFIRNEIDFFSGIQSSFASQLILSNGTLRPELNDHINFFKSHYLNTEYLGINLEAFPKDHAIWDKRVRQALNLALDKNLLVKTYRFGIGTPANAGFIPKGLISYDPNSVKGYVHDAARAKDLLKSSGYFEKSKLEKELVIYTNKDYLDLVTFIARQWQEIGIELRIELLETGTLREKMRNGSIGFFRASWIADYPDEESFMTVFYSKNGAPPNYTRFKNVEFDQLYEAAVKEIDNDKRVKLFQQMDRIIVEESPVIFLLYDQTALFGQKNLINLNGNPINLLKLEQVNEIN